MFIGKYYHTLEEQGRVSLPKEFRTQNKDWIVTRGLDGGLFLFPADKFQQKLQEGLAGKTFTKKAHRDFMRLMANDAARVEADDNGRVRLPDYLIELAGLNKHLVIVGSMDRLEIWERDVYHLYIEELEAKAEKISESLHESN